MMNHIYGIYMYVCMYIVTVLLTKYYCGALVK